MSNLETLLNEGRTVEVVFTKTDGSRRTMRCTLDNSYIASHNTAQKKTDRSHAQSPEVIVAFDVENNAYRSIRRNSVINYRAV